MAGRAKSKKYTFPYLRDESQSVAKAYGAQCTPEFFLFDAARKLRYHGRLDDALEPEKAKVRYLRDAVNALLTGKAPAVAETAAMGCSIKWKM